MLTAKSPLFVSSCTRTALIRGFSWLPSGLPGADGCSAVIYDQIQELCALSSRASPVHGRRDPGESTNGPPAVDFQVDLSLLKHCAGVDERFTKLFFIYFPARNFLVIHENHWYSVAEFHCVTPVTGVDVDGVNLCVAARDDRAHLREDPFA